MITGVAICPHPPLLVPAIAGAAAAETDELRAACDTAVARLLAGHSDQVVVIGGDGEGDQGDHATGLRGFAPGLAGLPEADERLPLSLAMGAWLLDRARITVARQLVGVRADGTPAAGWPDVEPRTALLVMGDGSARRSAKAPGYLDDRAGPFDAAIVKALANADVEALANLDPCVCAELLVGGVGAWKALASLLRPGAPGGGQWRAEVLYDDAPYGVQYTVATWRPA